jgi:hypothetical protein
MDTWGRIGDVRNARPFLGAVLSFAQYLHPLKVDFYIASFKNIQLSR